MPEIERIESKPAVVLKLQDACLGIYTESFMTKTKQGMCDQLLPNLEAVR
jgi:hypothetical protein